MFFFVINHNSPYVFPVIYFKSAMDQLVTVRRTTDDDPFDAYASLEYDDQAVLIKNGSVVSLPHEVPDGLMEFVLL